MRLVSTKPLQRASDNQAVRCRGDPAATCVVTGNTLGVTEVLTNGLLRNRLKRPRFSLKTRSSVDQFDGLHDVAS